MRFGVYVDPSVFLPMPDIWTSSAQRWVCLSPDIPHYPQSPWKDESRGRGHLHHLLPAQALRFCGVLAGPLPAPVRCFGTRFRSSWTSAGSMKA